MRRPYDFGRKKPEPVSLAPENPETVTEWLQKVLGGESFDHVPQGYRRHVRSMGVEMVKDKKLSVDEYLRHFK